MAETTSRLNVLKQCALTGVLTAVYLLIAIPFKAMSVIPGFTDIRPVMLLKPVYGVFFGIPGCVAFAIGNLIGDIISDSLRWSSVAGVAANFLGPFFFYFFWKRISKTPFSLRTGKALLTQLIVIVASAVIEVAVLLPAVKLVDPKIDGMLFAVTVFLNGTMFPLLFGIPLMILMQEELGFKPITKEGGSP